MPLAKQSFVRAAQVDAAGLPNLSTRLVKVSFGLNYDLQVLGTDRADDQLAVEIAQRRQREPLGFDETRGALVPEKRYEYRRLFFNLDTKAHVASTPGAKRDLSVFLELLRRCGATEMEFSDLVVDLLPWAESLLKLYETAQLGGLVLDQFYAEPRLIGRFSAKTVDNRLDLKALANAPGKLRSLRLGFFYEGLRRSVEARFDGVLSVTSNDEDDLPAFLAEQQKLYLKHATGSE